MAPPAGTLRVSRYFLALFGIFVVLYGVIALPAIRNTPKLGIDLVGGIRVIFTAEPPAGQPVTQNSLAQARQIIENRINGSGVTASTVQVQGNDQLVVSIPGGTTTDVARLGKAAQLNFRPLIAPAVPVTCNEKKQPRTNAAGAGGSTASSKSSSPSSASPSNKPNSVRERPLAAPGSGTATPAAATTGSTTPKGAASGSTTPKGATSGSATPQSAASGSAQPRPACLTDPIKTVKKADPKLTIPTTAAGWSKLPKQQQQEIQAALTNFDCNSATLRNDNPNSYYVSCYRLGGATYGMLLGTVIVPGRQIDQAMAVAPNQSGQGGSTQWTVSLQLKSGGSKAWGNWTTKHNISGATAPPSITSCGSQCNDFVAFTLDGRVLSAPVTNEPIVGQATQISGNFTQTSANQLADQLKYGALPLSFRTDSNQRVSASLGTSQLKAALLAGGIGLILVVLYSLLYYRALGLITIASLAVSAGLTYAMMVILGDQIGFTLDLSGIAGLIVALGITADSFVVFFERMKDEVHEGRSARVAVPRAWVRARRTILSADTVSFLAAAILYYFASADVKGFAFTLGLSTILDLVVVFLFTHPIVSLLSRSSAFASARFTGLSSMRDGGITADPEPSRGKRTVVAGTTGGDAAERAAARRGTTALLEKRRQDETADVAEPGESDEPAVPGAEAPESEPEPDDTPSGPDDEQAPDEQGPDEDASGERRHTNPQQGSAAERAAARRRRMRQTDDDGDDGDDGKGTPR